VVYSRVHYPAWGTPLGPSEQSFLLFSRTLRTVFSSLPRPSRTVFSPLPRPSRTVFSPGVKKEEERPARRAGEGGGTAVLHIRKRRDGSSAHREEEEGRPARRAGEGGKMRFNTFNSFEQKLRFHIFNSSEQKDGSRRQGRAPTNEAMTSRGNDTTVPPAHPGLPVLHFPLIPRLRQGVNQCA